MPKVISDAFKQLYDRLTEEYPDSSEADRARELYRKYEGVLKLAEQEQVADLNLTLGSELENLNRDSLADVDKELLNLVAETSIERTKKIKAADTAVLALPFIDYYTKDLTEELSNMNINILYQYYGKEESHKIFKSIGDLFSGLDDKGKDVKLDGLLKQIEDMQILINSYKGKEIILSELSPEEFAVVKNGRDALTLFTIAINNRMVDLDKVPGAKDGPVNKQKENLEKLASIFNVQVQLKDPETKKSFLAQIPNIEKDKKSDEVKTKIKNVKENIMQLEKEKNKTKLYNDFVCELSSAFHRATSELEPQAPKSIPEPPKLTEPEKAGLLFDNVKNTLNKIAQKPQSSNLKTNKSISDAQSLLVNIAAIEKDTKGALNKMDKLKFYMDSKLADHQTMSDIKKQFNKEYAKIKKEFKVKQNQYKQERIQIKKEKPSLPENKVYSVNELREHHLPSIIDYYKKIHHNLILARDVTPKDMQNRINKYENAHHVMHDLQKAYTRHEMLDIINRNIKSKNLPDTTVKILKDLKNNIEKNIEVDKMQQANRQKQEAGSLDKNPKQSIENPELRKSAPGKH